jgi:hypothetical protein
LQRKKADAKKPVEESEVKMQKGYTRRKKGETEENRVERNKRGAE